MSKLAIAGYTVVALMHVGMFYVGYTIVGLAPAVVVYIFVGLFYLLKRLQGR